MRRRSLTYRFMPMGNTNLKYAIIPRRHHRPLMCFLPRMARMQITVHWR